MAFHPKQLLLKTQEGHYAIATWPFWRTLLVVFCVFCWVGHWLEVPWCLFMNNFGIVDASYALWFEPWYCPYWVYGIGAVAVTLVLEPWKEHIQKKCKTTWGALLAFFVGITLISAVLETVIGLIINQYDPAIGKFPFWDNSQLPLNILGQGWLVNDLMLGVVGSLYLWVFYPAIDDGLRMLSPKMANVVLVIILVLFALATLFSYVFI